MPELPEVETVRRGLKPALEGHVVAALSVRRRDLRVAFPERFAERLKGRRMVSLRRRAKYLLLDLEGGETLIMHLGMSGRFTIHGPAAPPAMPGRFHNQIAADGSGNGKHDHVVFETEEGVRIVFTDHRRFGLMLLAKTDAVEQHSLFDGMGPEPLGDDFTPTVLSAALKGKKTPIKSALLDQCVVAGLGNIYVCEALFRSGISPKRLARTVAGPRCEKLVPAIKKVLGEAIKAGGSTLRDYKKADGELGYFQHHFAVYDREGEPCPGCKGTIKRIVQAGRSTFYCPSCQK
ncbi:MAG: bifunctional DNA-formamidopyrimidine glycosylase/DNA-(apurinic or apyrimidinic site) lyase [Alphaproteobacteria bacterium]|nr:bifunctional DNA-formamidopyrimidine glycosylase/DNA-(apurinic or apyrimidinic site) lyase [Alphaproteobacteria bacterium]